MMLPDNDKHDLLLPNFKWALLLVKRTLHGAGIAALYREC